MSTGKKELAIVGAILMTEKEVESEYGLNCRYLQALRYRGGGPKYVRLGRHCVRYTRISIENYIEQHTVRSTSDQIKSDRDDQMVEEV